MGISAGAGGPSLSLGLSFSVGGPDSFSDTASPAATYPISIKSSGQHAPGARLDEWSKSLVSVGVLVAEVTDNEWILSGSAYLSTSWDDSPQISFVLTR